VGNTSRKGEEQLKVVIADDSALVRKHLNLMLSTIEGVLVSGMAEDGIEALRLVRELEPSVLVLDISMPNKNGIEVLKEIRRNNQSTVIIMYTADVEPQLRDFCVQAGANFFLHKTQIKELVSICEHLAR
jgi:DNA-binding NarL/FixJ family response regulator